MDVDLFLKTYSINVILGMWDDYWGNKNNYYFFFDKSGKAFFIPYDYDNILGVSCSGICADAGIKSPLEWGATDNTRPLINKMLAVPDFLAKYKQYLVEYSDQDSKFYYSKSIERITNWQNLVRNYISCSDNVNTSGSYHSIDDFPATWGTTPFYKLLTGESGVNFFKTKTEVISYFTADNVENITVSLNPNGGTLSGENSYSLEKGSAILLSDLGIPTKNSYIFVGWYSSTDSNAVKIESVGFSDVTLYAKWLDPSSWIYHFDSDKKNVTFTFDPDNFDFEDFWINVCTNGKWQWQDNLGKYDETDIKGVYLASSKDWSNPTSETWPHDAFTKQENGIWTYTISLDDLPLDSLFKFIVTFDDDNSHDWFGADSYIRIEVPEGFKENRDDPNFILKDF